MKTCFLSCLSFRWARACLSVSMLSRPARVALQIQGEQLVLEANGKGGLKTCALRPSGIFGEHDPLFVPTLIEKVILLAFLPAFAPMLVQLVAQVVPRLFSDV